MPGRLRSMAAIWAVALAAATGPSSAQSLLDMLNRGAGALQQQGGGTDAAGLSEGEVAGGLREALGVGIVRVVERLGRPGGFLEDPRFHIPLPSPLDKAQSALRMAGLSGLADDLEVRMNRGAESAVPVAKDLFLEAVRNLTFEDAMAIFRGPPDSATRYLERTSGTELANRMRPIVEDALADAGAVQLWDQLVGQAASLPFVGSVQTGLTDHVLDWAKRALFGYLAEEEKAIRQNPAARTTELLQKVFGGT